MVSPTAALLTNVVLNATGGVIAKKAGALVLREDLPAVGVIPNNSPLSYDISKWDEYGLPSDGTFVRTLTPQQYRDWSSGREFDFAGGKFPDYGYPDGMGFIGAAEEVRHIDTVAGYKEALKLDYDPKIVMEFQLKDPSRLQNALDAPFQEFVRGGRTGAGSLEWNYPGISTSDITNATVRKLK